MSSEKELEPIAYIPIDEQSMEKIAHALEVSINNPDKPMFAVCLVIARRDSAKGIVEINAGWTSQGAKEYQAGRTERLMMGLKETIRQIKEQTGVDVAEPVYRCDLNQMAAVPTTKQ